MQLHATSKEGFQYFVPECDARRPHAENCVRFQANQLVYVGSYAICVDSGPAKVKPNVAAFNPPQLRELVAKRDNAHLNFWIGLVIPCEHANSPLLPAAGIQHSTRGSICGLGPLAAAASGS